MMNDPEFVYDEGSESDQSDHSEGEEDADHPQPLSPSSSDVLDIPFATLVARRIPFPSDVETIVLTSTQDPAVMLFWDIDALEAISTISTFAQNLGSCSVSVKATPERYATSIRDYCVDVVMAITGLRPLISHFNLFLVDSI